MAIADPSAAQSMVSVRPSSSRTVKRGRPEPAGPAVIEQLQAELGTGRFERGLLRLAPVGDLGGEVVGMSGALGDLHVAGEAGGREEQEREQAAVAGRGRWSGDRLGDSHPFPDAP